MLADAESTVERRAIRVRGMVQGVGFRPFVYRIARELGLDGWVCNDPDGVSIEVQGPCAALERFEHALRSDAPPRSSVARVDTTVRARVAPSQGFAILASRAGPTTTGIAPDTATCADCLAELFDPADRRHRYACINCTQCGPRYTLTRALPYDRATTSMAAFPLCASCRREYADPADRRFHAEPNACPACGPTLRLLDANGVALAGDPIGATLELLRTGRIVAIKGLGGFHLACDARNASTVALLRRRKQREEKPFALLAGDLDAALRWVHASAAEQALLASPERPIVLLAQRADRSDPLDGVAPGLDTLGVMLPTTPIQFLLCREAPDLLLVMTSANPGGEPLVTDNAQALQRLHGICDALLLHDRDIVARCDDSVLRMSVARPPEDARHRSAQHEGVPKTVARPPEDARHRSAQREGVPKTVARPQFIRRARGWTPRPIPLARAGPPVLATGAWLNNTVCITRGDEAFLSPHIGDLDNAATCTALTETVSHMCTVLDVRPQAVAHDLHPDFFSTRFALQYATEHHLPEVAVQHHHAHVAAIVAEHGASCAGGPLLGLALDGVGLGDDGAAWGGELLRVDGASFRRLGHLAPLALPGGDVAAREPWRMAAAALHAIGRTAEIERRFPHRPAAAAVAQMLEHGLRCPPSTSLGRWFDAAAGLLGVRETSAYEGQAPMLLEALATAQPFDPSQDLRHLVLLGGDGTLDPTPLITHLADRPAGHGTAFCAALFHHALADGLARWVAQATRGTGLDRVALGGGCFLNALLGTLLLPRLHAQGLQVLEASQAPPGDGGIALGQAWVAICKLNQEG